MDTILLLSQTALYVVSFDEDMEKIVLCHRVHLEDLSKIEVGRFYWRLHLILHSASLGFLLAIGNKKESWGHTL